MVSWWIVDSLRSDSSCTNKIIIVHLACYKCFCALMSTIAGLFVVVINTIPVQSNNNEGKYMVCLATSVIKQHATLLCVSANHFSLLIHIGQMGSMLRNCLQYFWPEANLDWTFLSPKF